MMLMLLLTELTRLGVHLSAGPDGLRVQAPAGALTDELRQAMTEHKAALLRYAAYPYVETVDGRGTLTGARRETDPFYYGTRHGERLRYKIGVRLLGDGLERFYLPGIVWEVKRPGCVNNFLWEARTDGNWQLAPDVALGCSRPGADQAVSPFSCVPSHLHCSDAQLGVALRRRTPPLEEDRPKCSSERCLVHPRS